MEGEIPNLSYGLLFSNDLFNNYLCNQRNQGPAKKKISTLHTPIEQPEKKVNKMPLADRPPSISKTMAGLSCRLRHTHIKVRFPGKNFTREIRGSD